MQTSPLRYIDSAKDAFVDSYDCLYGNWNDLNKADCKIEPSVQTFLKLPKAFLPSQQGAEVDEAQRYQLAQTFMFEVERLRDVPQEDRGWDIDVVLG